MEPVNPFEFMRMLDKLIEGNEEKTVKVQVATMSAEDQATFNDVQALKDTARRKQQEVRQLIEEIDARMRLFWIDVYKRHKLSSEPEYRINSDNWTIERIDKVEADK